MADSYNVQQQNKFYCQFYNKLSNSICIAIGSNSGALINVHFDSPDLPIIKR
jgi:hypothetical protein